MPVNLNPKNLRAVAGTNVALVLISCLLFVLAGCGGGSKSNISAASGKGRGKLSFSVRWPEPKTGRLIPLAANAIQVVARKTDGSEAAPPVVITRPATSAVLNGLDPGAVTVTANAFSDAEALPKPPLASGTVRVTVIADQMIQTSLVMDSTIATVEITPSANVKIKKGTDLQLNATARDATGAVVLTTVSKWGWQTSNMDIVELRGAGGTLPSTVTAFATFRGVSEGEATITATESESGVSAQVTVTVPTRYTLTPLGTFAGGDESYGFGINETGQVVGWAEEGTVTRPFLWQPTAPNAPTGTLVNLNPGGPFEAVAYDINSRGQVTGYFFNGSGYQGALLWSPGTPNGTTGTVTNLGNFGLGAPRTGYKGAGFAINDQGTISGLAFSANPGSAPATGIRWQPGVPNGSTGTATILGDVSGQATDIFSAGFDITESGLVFGQAANTSQFGDAFPNRAFVWSDTMTGGPASNPKMRRLEAFGNPNTPATFKDTAFSVREIAGGLLVAGMARAANGARHATLWTATSATGPYSPTDLGVQDFSESVAYGVNRQRQVVGAMGYAISAPVFAVLWENGETISLSDTIPTSSGALLLEARAINDFGQIVCSGRDLASGKQRAYLLTPN